MGCWFAAQRSRRLPMQTCSHTRSNGESHRALEPSSSSGKVARVALWGFVEPTAGGWLWVWVEFCMPNIILCNIRFRPCLLCVCRCAARAGRWENRLFNPCSTRYSELCFNACPHLKTRWIVEATTTTRKKCGADVLNPPTFPISAFFFYSQHRN